MRKRNVRAAIAAALCMTVLAAGCGKKADDPVFTGDKTEAPVYQANLDAIKSSAYASADNLDLEPGTYISVIGRGSSTPYWNQVKAGVEQAATDNKMDKVTQRNNNLLIIVVKISSIKNSLS